MQTQKFWSRLGQWFRKTDDPTAPVGIDGPTALPGHSGSDSPTDEPTVVASTSTEPPRTLTRFRRSRANHDIERLEAQYARVEHLMDLIEGHMESQSNRSERIACSLDRLAETLAGVPEAFRHQSETLSSISETVTSEQVRATRIEESLSQWPQVADAQRETMVSISRQLDESREVNSGVASAVQECRSAFAGLGETTKASTKAIERFAGDSTANHEQLARLLEKQAGRFQMFAWAAIGLAGVAALVAVIALLT